MKLMIIASEIIRPYTFDVLPGAYGGFMPSYKIVLAEDHIPLRRIIKKIVQGTDGLNVVGEVKDGLELLELLEQSLPDMVITDISMPRLGGLEATKKIKELYPQIKVLILTFHREKDYLHEALSNGVDGYILKQDMDQEIYSAIAAVRRGQVYVSGLLEAT
jgi:DNA-binding NarL/FixJ family response regulator